MVARRGGLSFLIFCAIGVFFSYLIYGIFQEKVTKTKYGHQLEAFNYFFTLLLFQCVVNSIFSKFAQIFFRERSPSIGEWHYALCGFTYIGAMFASNFSLKFVSYPTQVVGKSVKPIPVMLLNVLLAKRKYPLKKYLFVLMISLGVFLFMYKSTASSMKTFIGWGECLLLLSLLFDGFTGGVQEAISQYKIGSYTLMFHMNMWSVLYLTIAMLFTGEGSSFFAFAQRHPTVLINMSLFGLTSAIGQVFLFTLVTNFGSLTCAIVTTTRKFFTVLASIVLFSHAMTNQQWIGTILVFGGILLDQYYSKAGRTPIDKKLEDSSKLSDAELGKKRKNNLKSS